MAHHLANATLCLGWHALDCVAMHEEQEFLAVVILALACAVCALCGMVGITAMISMRLAQVLSAARAATQPDAKVGLLSSVTGRIAPKKKRATFADTSCEAPRDLDEEEI